MPAIAIAFGKRESECFFDKLLYDHLRPCFGLNKSTRQLAQIKTKNRHGPRSVLVNRRSLDQTIPVCFPSPQSQELVCLFVSHLSAPTLLTWGAFAGITVLFLFEPVPIARRDIFSQFPIVGKYWQDKLDKAAQVD